MQNIEQLQKAMAELESAYKDVRMECNNLTQQVRTGGVEIDRLKRLCTDKDRMMQSLLSERNGLVVMNEQLNKAYAELSGRLDVTHTPTELRAVISTLQRQCNVKDKELGELREQYSLRCQERNHLEKEVEALKMTVGQVEVANNEKQETIQRLVQQVDLLEAIRAGQVGVIKRLHEENLSLKAVVSGEPVAAMPPPEVPVDLETTKVQLSTVIGELAQWLYARYRPDSVVPWYVLDDANKENWLKDATALINDCSPFRGGIVAKWTGAMGQMWSAPIQEVKGLGTPAKEVWQGAPFKPWHDPADTNTPGAQLRTRALNVLLIPKGQKCTLTGTDEAQVVCDQKWYDYLWNADRRLDEMLKQVTGSLEEDRWDVLEECVKAKNTLRSMPWAEMQQLAEEQGVQVGEMIAVQLRDKFRRNEDKLRAQDKAIKGLEERLATKHEDVGVTRYDVLMDDLKQTKEKLIKANDEILGLRRDVDGERRNIERLQRDVVERDRQLFAKDITIATMQATAVESSQHRSELAKLRSQLRLIYTALGVPLMKQDLDSFYEIVKEWHERMVKAETARGRDLQAAADELKALCKAVGLYEHCNMAEVQQHILHLESTVEARNAEIKKLTVEVEGEREGFTSMCKALSLACPHTFNGVRSYIRLLWQENALLRTGVTGEARRAEGVQTIQLELTLQEMRRRHLKLLQSVPGGISSNSVREWAAAFELEVQRLKQEVDGYTSIELHRREVNRRVSRVLYYLDMTAAALGVPLEDVVGYK